MKRFALTLSALALGACATVIDHQTQHVTIETPGAADAKCMLYNQDMRYEAWAGQTIEIMKSPNDLAVNCLASGNREKTVLVKRGVNGWIIANVANGFIPGTTYDYFSRGMFTYPKEIVVSFVGEPIREYPLPQYMDSELGNNNIYNRLPYEGPDEVITQGTRLKGDYELQKIDRNYGGDTLNDFGHYGQGVHHGSVTSYPLDSIHRRYNPHVGYDPTEEDK